MKSGGALLKGSYQKDGLYKGLFEEFTPQIPIQKDSIKPYPNGSHCEGSHRVVLANHTHFVKSNKIIKD